MLYLCDRQGLIGRQMFAIYGVKLPANASKAKSGTRADSQRQASAAAPIGLNFPARCSALRLSPPGTGGVCCVP